MLPAKTIHRHRLVSRTKSLCPVCLKRIDAARIEVEGDLWLTKRCAEHGEFSVPIWVGSPSWEKWQRPKISASPLPGSSAPANGCPFDCGLCSEHRQRSCTVIIDVTERCDLVCPVCFADSTRSTKSGDPGLDELRDRFKAVANISRGSNIQLSGGEPTLREDLADIIRIGKGSGCSFIQLNTNGIRLSEDKAYLKRLAEAGLDSVFLQFDGTTNAIYQKIRGRELLEKKLTAISACAEMNIGVVLVVTVVPGVNDGDLGNLLKLAAEKTPVVRGIHFQPISYFGRFPSSFSGKKRITLPELMRAIEMQTQGAFPAEQFSPPGCENAMCSFSGRFLIQQDNSVNLVFPSWNGCCEEPQHAEKCAVKSITQTAQQWSGAPEEYRQQLPQNETTSVIPRLDGKEPVMDLDQFLRQARTRTLAVSAMAFQDAWTLDLDRVKDCCIHVADSSNRLIPFCLYNLTSSSGKGLYRS